MKNSGLSIRFEVDGDILKVNGYGGRMPSNRRGIWRRLMPPAGYRGRAPLGVPGLSIRFEVDGDILTVDGYGGWRPSHRRGVWGLLTPPPPPPSGVQGQSPFWGVWIVFFFLSVSAYRYVAHRQYTYWIHKKVDQKIRITIPYCVVKKIEKASQVKVEVTGAFNMPIRSLAIMNIT